MSAPCATVIVLSYQGRDRIDRPLRSLRRQNIEDPFEVIVVDSGSDGCAEYVADRYPEVRIVRSETRLWPAAGRNRGIDAARGQYVAFLPDDCIAVPGWLHRRVELHRRGYEIVGGSVLNGTPRSAVGTASYLLEYATVLPTARALERQQIPHSLSFSREVFRRFGRYPEDVRMGEDTIFNRRCVEARIPIAFDPAIAIVHGNPTRLTAYLRHQQGHGQALVRCALDHGLYPQLAEELRRGAASASFELLVRYPLGRLVGETRAVTLGMPRALPRFALLSPLVAAGVASAAVGAWQEWKSSA